MTIYEDDYDNDDVLPLHGWSVSSCLHDECRGVVGRRLCAGLGGRNVERRLKPDVM